jgi:hypothetical protein
MSAEKISMRSQSHKTFIGQIREHVSEWRKSKQWSRESVVQDVVEAHISIGGPAATGISFAPSTQDSFERMKVNADRVFRWLDDETKDTNLMPANFLPTILSALPPDLRASLLDELLRPLGLGVRHLSGAVAPDMDTTGILRSVLKEGGEAYQALVELIPAATPAALGRALKEISESIQAQTQAREVIEATLARGTADAP